MRTLTDLGFDPDKVPEKYRTGFSRVVGASRTWRSKFYDLPEEEQRRIFNNDLLFSLWKREKLSLGSLVHQRNGMFVPKSYRQVFEELPKLGGLSSPNAEVAGLDVQVTTKQKTLFLAIVDPVDRADAGLILIPSDTVKDRDLGLRGKYGGDAMGDGQDIIEKRGQFDSLVSQVLELMAGANLRKGGPLWLDQNEALRMLGVYRRIATDGSVYYAIPKRVFERIKMGPSK